MTYTITKYGQSCFLIDRGDRRLVIDPGSYALKDSGMTPDRWPEVLAVLVTHEHPDHASPALLRGLQDRFGCTIVTNKSCALKLGGEGIPASVVKPGQTMMVAGFEVRGVAQQHGDVPPTNAPGPEDLGFLVDRTFYHTGDSVPLGTMPRAEVLFVPVTGPQMSFTTARQMIATVRPRLAIPMHYSNQAKFPIDLAEVRRFAVSGVTVRFLDDGASLRWPDDVPA